MRIFTMPIAIRNFKHNTVFSMKSNIPLKVHMAEKSEFEEKSLLSKVAENF